MVALLDVRARQSMARHYDEFRPIAKIEQASYQFLRRYAYL